MYIPFFGAVAVSKPLQPQPELNTGVLGTTPIYTETGPIPAEHLQAGDRLLGRGRGGPTILKAVLVDSTREPLVRIAPDALGRARPDNFALLAPDQRLLLRRAADAPRDGVFTARDLIDGDTIRWYEPDQPVQLAHLVLDGTRIVHAGGMELEITS